jgi:hypothetical protein
MPLAQSLVAVDLMPQPVSRVAPPGLNPFLMLTQPYGFAFARLGLGYLLGGPPALSIGSNSRVQP